MTKSPWDVGGEREKAVKLTKVEITTEIIAVFLKHKVNNKDSIDILCKLLGTATGITGADLEVVLALVRVYAGQSKGQCLEDLKRKGLVP